MNVAVKDHADARRSPAEISAPVRTPEELSAIRAGLETKHQANHRARREALARNKALLAASEASEVARRSFGTPGAPEDFGADGQASIARGLVKEDADGAWTGSATRRGPEIKRHRVQCECVLDALFMRSNGSMTADEYMTGLKFRRYWIASRHASRVSGDYGQRLGGSASALRESEYRTDARIAIDLALKLLSDLQRRAIIATCGEDQLLGLRSKAFYAGLTILNDKWLRQVKKS